MDAKDETYSYVTYGMLHKNHEFVDWVRVDLEEDDKVRVQNASASADADSFKDMDERAFEKLKTQWQEISASEAAMGRSGSNDSLAKVQDSINLGKKLLASASAKTLTPDSISYGVFDADWNPVKFTPRHSNVDVAILLHAASREGKNNNETADTKMRTYLTETLDNGSLPIVPVKRSAQQQFLIKQSVQLFFRKDSIQFFACFPLRYSPRTIYRFDMINGGIDHTFWQKVKINNGIGSSSIRNLENKPSMNDKLTEMRVKMASNTADFRENFQKGTDEIKNSFQLSVAKTQESILNLTNKKQPNPLLLTNNDTANEEEAAHATTTTKVPAKQKLTEMRLKMTNNAFQMKNTLASKMSTTKGSLLKMNHKHQSDEATDATAVDASETKEAEKPNVTARLSTMKLRMSGNMMKFGFGSKAAPTKKESFWSMRKKKSTEVADTEAPTEATKPMPTTLTEVKQRMTENTNQMKQRMTENTNQMKQRMTENTNQMKQRMTENTNQMKTSFASTVTATKQSFLNITTKKSTDSAAVPAKEGESDIDSLLSEEFTFTIDGEDDDDHATPISTPSGASSPAGYVALSLDDAPCRFDDRSHSQLENVLDLLKKYNAKATFMVISSFLADCHEPDMIRLLVEGHELANHGVKDEAMDKMATSVDTFVEAIDECNAKITELQKKAHTEVGVKWFRAPQAKYTKIMEEGLVQRDMHNVMCDAYAACPIVEDGPWIANVLSKQIRNGSIALLHMPEKRGFREHCLEALELLLEDLQKRNFKVVTVGELDRIAKEVAALKQGESKEQEVVFSSV